MIKMLGLKCKWSVTHLINVAVVVFQVSYVILLGTGISC